MSGQLRGVPTLPEDPDDPLVRRRVFEEAHPGVKITPPSKADPWWHAQRDGQVVAYAYMLGGLMDRLERLTSGEKP